jgi:hypothetical protein
VIVGIEEQSGTCKAYQGIYPTVLRSGSAMRITYGIIDRSKVSVKMYDVCGRKVAQIYSGFPVQNLLDITYRPTNLPNGIYFVYVERDNDVDVKKIVITR